MPRRLAAWILMTLACLLARQTTLGQGMHGIVPDPITSDDVARMILAVGADDGQQRTIEAAHEAYIDAFLAWRDGEVERCLERMWHLRGQELTEQNRRRIDNPVARHLLAEVERLHAALAARDEQFFDVVRPALHESQVHVWERLRLSRARARVALILRRFEQTFPPARVDLERLCQTLNLAQTDAADIQPILDEYSATLTPLHDEAFALLLRMHQEIFDLVVARGFEEYSETFVESDPVMVALREASTIIAERIVRAGMRISALNRRTLEQLANALPAAECAALTAAYEQQAYAEMPRRILPVGVREAMLASTALSDDKRERLRRLLEEFSREEQSLRSSMMDQCDAWYAANPSLHHRADDRGRPPSHPALADLTQRHEEFAQRISAAVTTILGDEWEARVREQMSAAPASARPALDAASPRWPPQSAGVAARHSALHTFAAGGASPMQPLSRSTIEEFVQRSDLDEPDGMHVAAVHQAYLKQFDSLQKEISRLDAIRSTLWRRNRDTGRLPTTVRQVMRYHADLKSCHTAIRALNESLAGELTDVIERSEPSEREMFMRCVRIWMRSMFAAQPERSSQFITGQRSQEASVDLAALALAEGLAVERPALGDVLASYESSLLGLREQAQEETDAMTRLDAMHTALRIEQVNADQRMDRETQAQYERQSEALGEALGETSRKLRRLNRETLDSLLGLLEARERQRFRAAYARLAFPDLVNAWPPFDAAWDALMKLPSLSAQQLGELQLVGAEFALINERLLETAIRVVREAEDAMNPHLSEFDARFQFRVQRLAFEAQERYARMSRRVRDRLSAAQWEALSDVSRSNHAADTP